MDILRADTAAPPPLGSFHGACRQHTSREVFARPAEGPLALGMDVAMPGATLAPPRGGGFARGLVLVGDRSANGQPGVAGGLDVSGIFDIGRCRASRAAAAVVRPRRWRRAAGLPTEAPERPAEQPFSILEPPARPDGALARGLGAQS